VSEFVWPLTMLAATVSLIMVIRVVMPLLKRSTLVMSALTWIGVNSLFIFAVHGFLRWQLVDMATLLVNPYITIVLGLLFFLVSIVTAWVIRKMERSLQRSLIEPYLLKVRQQPL
jgi:fucose 4-O-acetylase-like acetyltransferase